MTLPHSSCRCIRCRTRDVIKKMVNLIAMRSDFVATLEADNAALYDTVRRVHDHLWNAISQVVRDRDRYRSLLRNLYGLTAASRSIVKMSGRMQFQSAQEYDLGVQIDDLLRKIEDVPGIVVNEEDEEEGIEGVVS